MAKERASINGGKVKSVHVGQVWTEITISVPTKRIVLGGARRNPKGPKGASSPAKKAWQKRQAEQQAAAASAGESS